jgi:cation diffusion facilitator CzcD-associated flavoprotein CzcO
MWYDFELTPVKIAQECAKTAGDLTVFVRTPNIALPMRQDAISSAQQVEDKLTYSDMFKQRLTTDGGFVWTSLGFPHKDHSTEEREALFEDQWRRVNPVTYL